MNQHTVFRVLLSLTSGLGLVGASLSCATRHSNDQARVASVSAQGSTYNRISDSSYQPQKLLIYFPGVEPENGGLRFHPQRQAWTSQWQAAGFHMYEFLSDKLRPTGGNLAIAEQSIWRELAQQAARQLAALLKELTAARQAAGNAEPFTEIRLVGFGHGAQIALYVAWRFARVGLFPGALRLELLKPYSTAKSLVPLDAQVSEIRVQAKPITEVMNLLLQDYAALSGQIPVVYEAGLPSSVTANPTRASHLQRMAKDWVGTPSKQIHGLRDAYFNSISSTAPRFLREDGATAEAFSAQFPSEDLRDASVFPSPREGLQVAGQKTLNLQDDSFTLPELVGTKPQPASQPYNWPPCTQEGLEKLTVDEKIKLAVEVSKLLKPFLQASDPARRLAAALQLALTITQDSSHDFDSWKSCYRRLLITLHPDHLKAGKKVEGLLQPLSEIHETLRLERNRKAKTK